MALVDTFKRKEMKFLLTHSQKEALLDMISDRIEMDAYPKYTICNLYMDTPDSRLIRKSIEKPLYKEKMRVRCYGEAHEKTSVYVELKKKYEGIVYKRRIKMPIDEAKAFILGEASRTGQIENEIDYFIDYYQGIKPAMYIAYDRQAYKAKEDDQLRITFDDNIMWREDDLSLMSPVSGRQLLEDDQCLLEIKCAGAMPLWLAKALSNQGLYKRSFSKYGKAYEMTIKKELIPC